MIPVIYRLRGEPLLRALWDAQTQDVDIAQDLLRKRKEALREFEKKGACIPLWRSRRVEQQLRESLPRILETVEDIVGLQCAERPELHTFLPSDLQPKEKTRFLSVVPKPAVKEKTTSYCPAQNRIYISCEYLSEAKSNVAHEYTHHLQGQCTNRIFEKLDKSYCLIRECSAKEDFATCAREVDATRKNLALLSTRLFLSEGHARAIQEEYGERCAREGDRSVHWFTLRQSIADLEGAHERLRREFEGTPSVDEDAISQYKYGVYLSMKWREANLPVSRLFGALEADENMAERIAKEMRLYDVKTVETVIAGRGASRATTAAAPTARA